MWFAACRASYGDTHGVLYAFSPTNRHQTNSVSKFEIKSTRQLREKCWILVPAGYAGREAGDV